MKIEPNPAPMPKPTPGLEPTSRCSLSPSGLAQRLAWVRDEILPFAIACERDGDSITWEFEDGPDIAANLDAWVSLERECCSSIAFRHTSDPEAHRRRLEVSGIDPGSALLGNALGLSTARPGPWKRALRAAGFGTAVSLFICCALPIAASALLSGTVAASIESLDAPLTVVFVAVVGGGGAWWWQRRSDQGADAVELSRRKSTRTDASTSFSSM